MTKIIHLEELRLAKKIVREVPDVLIALDKAYQLLYNKDEFIDIAHLINEMIDARIMLEMHLEVSKEYLRKNGVKE